MRRLRPRNVTASEAFTRLDTLAQLSALSSTTTPQPDMREEGSTYIIPAGATGKDWSKMMIGSVAAYQDGNWHELTPKEGWRAWTIDHGELLVFQSGSWAAITAGTGTSTEAPIFGVSTSADTINRLPVSSDAVLFGHDNQTPGSGHMRAFVNKSGNASILFEDDFSGRAELGLLGNDDFSLRVSAIRSSFQEAVNVKAAVPHVKTGTSMGV